MKSPVLIFRFLGLILFGAAGFYLGNLITPYLLPAADHPSICYWKCGGFSDAWFPHHAGHYP